jgi:hypothetical protein
MPDLLGFGLLFRVIVAAILTQTSDVRFSYYHGEPGEKKKRI